MDPGSVTWYVRCHDRATKETLEYMYVIVLATSLATQPIIYYCSVIDTVLLQDVIIIDTG